MQGKREGSLRGLSGQRVATFTIMGWGRAVSNKSAGRSFVEDYDTAAIGIQFICLRKMYGQTYVVGAKSGSDGSTIGGHGREVAQVQ